MRPLRIGIVAHRAFGALTGGSAGHVGGVEFQTSLLARWLAGQGHDVTFIVWRPLGEVAESVDGVAVETLCREQAGIRGVRFFHPRWTALVRALRKANAEVYYQNCAEEVTGQVALWCRLHRRRFVYSVASNMDCDAALPDLKTARERLLYTIGLRMADRVIAQTLEQRLMLKGAFDVDSQVIAMPGLDLAQSWQPHMPPARARAIWVGRIVPVKRLEFLLDVAERLPGVQFDIIGPVEEDSGYTRRLVDRARALANVSMSGRVSRDRMPEVYAQATCLVCTSRFEGFPNTFLESWSLGVPIVTTWDPAGVVSGNSLGIVVTSASECADAIENIVRPDVWRTYSASARLYYVSHHRPEVVLPQFEQVFAQIVERAS